MQTCTSGRRPHALCPRTSGWPCWAELAPAGAASRGCPRDRAPAAAQPGPSAPLPAGHRQDFARGAPARERQFLLSRNPSHSPELITAANLRRATGKAFQAFTHFNSCASPPSHPAASANPSPSSAAERLPVKHGRIFFKEIDFHTVTTPPWKSLQVSHATESIGITEPTNAWGRAGPFGRGRNSSGPALPAPAPLRARSILTAPPRRSAPEGSRPHLVRARAGAVRGSGSSRGSAPPQALPGALRAAIPGIDTRWSARTIHKHTGRARAVLPSEEEMLNHSGPEEQRSPEGPSRSCPLSPQPLALTAAAAPSAAQPGLRGGTEPEARDGGTAPGPPSPAGAGGILRAAAKGSIPPGSGAAEPSLSLHTAPRLLITEVRLSKCPRVPGMLEQMQSPEDAARQQHRIQMRPKPYTQSSVCPEVPSWCPAGRKNAARAPKCSTLRAQDVGILP